MIVEIPFKVGCDFSVHHSQKQKSPTKTLWWRAWYSELSSSRPPGTVKFFSVAVLVGQSSSGIITVIAGRASSMSNGPQTATSFTSLAGRSSLQTYSGTGKRSQPGRLRLMAKRSIHTMSQSLPASSCLSTFGGTVTNVLNTVLVRNTGKRMPASLAVAETSTCNPSAIAWARV